MLSPRKSFSLVALVLTFAAFAGIAITAKAAPNGFAFIDQVREMLGMTTAATPSRRTLAPISEIKNTADMFAMEPKPMFAPLGAFTPANLVVYRAGDGSAALSTAAAAAFLDEYTPAGAFVQSTALPTAAVGANRALTVAGSATSEGGLSRSADGKYLAVVGYNAPPATLAIVATTNNGGAGDVARVMGRVDSTGLVDSSTALIGSASPAYYSAGNIRSAAINGTSIYVAGSNTPFVAYTTLGSNTATSIFATGNSRVVNTFGGDVYRTTSTTLDKVTGLPTASATVTSVVTGLTTASGFFCFDVGNTGSMNACYIADGASLKKYSVAGATFTAKGTATITGSGSSLSGVTGYTSGNSVILYVSSPAKIETITDATGSGGTLSGASTNITLTGGPVTIGANAAFRGIAFSPEILSVASATPIDGATNIATSSNVAVTFSAAVDTSSITVQGSTGACSGSLQVSTDNFTNCIALGSPTPSNANKTFTSTPSSALASFTAYKIRVTTAAKTTTGSPLALTFTQANGFTTAPNVCDSCTLQAPSSTTVATSGTTALIYGRIFESGVTNPAGASASVTAQVGFGTQNSDPALGGWTWFPTTFNAQFTNDDEYQGTMTAPAIGGTYSYTYRFSFDGGANWTYADLDGNGSNAGLTFSTAQLGTMTVTGLSGPAVTSNGANPIGATTATLNGTATANGQATTAWFRYSISTPGTCNDNFGTRAPASGGFDAGTGNSPVAYTQAVTGLTASTHYYFCAIAQNPSGTALGALQQFDTTDGTLATDSFRSLATGDWNAPASWQSSHNGTFSDAITATLKPTSAAASILIRSANTITVSGTETGSSLTIVAGGNISGGGTLSLTGNWTNDSSSPPNAPATLVFNGSNNTQTIKNTNGFPLTNVTINHTGTGGATFTGPFSGPTSVSGLLRVQAGSANVPGSAQLVNVQIDSGGILTPDPGASFGVVGNWSNAGTFTANGSTVSFDGVSQTISGDNTFFNISTVASGDVLTFEAGKTQTVTNNITWTGDTNSVRTQLRSTVTGTRWNLHAPASRNITYVDVKDSDATGSASLINPTNSVDSGNNVNWFLTTYTLTVNAGTGGTTTPSGAVTVTQGASTNILATPSSGYFFKNWTVTAGSASIASATSANTTVLLASGNATIQANFTPVLSTSSPSLNFGNVPVNTTSPTSVTVTNNTGSTVTLNPPTITGPDASQFTVGSVGTLTLTAGASTTVGVSFAPTSTGSKGATLNITSSGGGIAAVSLTGTGVVVLNINDVSQNEGNAGSTNFHFTVSLTAPAPADVHFNLQAFGDTASEVDDFNASTGTGLIAQGQTSTGFDILVHGDTIPEPDETFHVNITGITGATPGDTTGVGTIVNDDVAETTVGVAGNVLTVTDVNGGTTADDIRITRSGPNVRIVDPTNALQAGTGCVQFDLNTVDCTYAGLTSVQVSSMDGNDTLTVNLSGGNPIPPQGINFDGGPQTSTPGDKLAITGNGQGNVTYNYTNAHDGSVVMSAFGKVSYTGLEPITNNGTATNVIFNLPAGPTAATLADNGFADGLTRLSGATFETTDFLSPSSSVQINRGNAADTMAVQALPELSSGLFIGATGGEFATVNFNGTINLAPNNSLSAYATGPISLTTISSDLNTLGAGSIVMTTATNIVMTSASSMQTADGAIVLNANQQASPTAGSYHGIDVNNALIESTGIGVVTVNGRGGDGSGIGVDQGVFVHGGGIIRGGNAAGVTTIVNGKGGLGGNGSNHGVDVGTASSITSNGGGVQVTGNGGSGGGDNYGVIPVSGGTITSGLNGNVTVIGTGGSGGGPNFGVIPHTGGTITSGGNGTVTVTGTGGNGSLSDGINIFRNGLIRSGGSGAVSVNGTAGAQGYGVYMDSVDNNSPGARINSGGGSITVTGICNPGSFAIVMGGGATNTIASTGNAPITLVGDAMALDGTGTNSVNSGTGTTTIRQFNNNRAINLGTSDDVPPGLDLSDGELDRVTAGTLNIGDAATTPNINVDGPISQTGKTTNLFTSGTTTVSSLGVLGITGTVHSYLDVIGTIAPGTSPGVINADGVTIYPAGTLNIELGGTTPGNTATNHDQVNSTSADFGFTVDGTLNVSFYNGFVPAPGDTFTIITSATTVDGAFTTVNWPAGYTGTVDYSDPAKIVLRDIGPPATTPTVTTDAPTNVAPNSATLNGTATPNGGTTTAFFRYYASDPGATCVDSGGTRVPDPSGGTNVPSGNGATAFNAIINGLTPATPYWYCAFATNSAGTGVGSPPRTFTTPAVDYTITTAGAIVVTDVTGHSDGLAMFEGPAGQLHFTAPGRFFSINGAAATTGNSGDVPLAGAASITVNENIGDDTIVISGITSQLPSLTVNGGTGNDITQISSAITFVTGANLDLDMQNDDPTPGNDQAVFASGSLVTLQGTGTVTVKVSQSAVFALNAGLSVVNGNMLIEANQQAVPTAIAFQGVVVDGGGLTTSGTGNIDIKGKGGSDAGTGGHSGISVVNSGVIRSTAVANGGTVTLNGKGGAGFDNNSGVEVFTNGFISSVTGDISVTGAGGAGTDVTNTGIHVATGGSIRSTGAAKVTLSGTGGTGTGRSTGVRIIGTGSLVTSSGGNVSITGVGNAAATQGANNGVTVTTGAVVSATGGTATVTINGTAGGGTDLNVGVALDGANTAVSSLAGDVTILSQGGTGTGVGQIGINISSGAKVTTTNAANISITGTGGSGSSDNYGVGMEGGTVNGTLVAANGTGNVSFTGTGGSAAGTDADGVRFEDSSGPSNPVGVTTASGSLSITGTAGNSDATSSGIQVVDDTTMTLGGASNTFVADSIAIGLSVTSINAGANAVTLRQKTNGIGIDIGGADSATALGLTDFELDVITAGTLNFGDANTGPITSTGLNRAATTNLVFTNGSTFAITLTSGQIASGNSGNVTFNPGSGGLKPTGSSFASEVYSGGGTTKVSPGRKLAIVVNGATVNAGYDQLGVAGFVDVTNAILEITGSYTPAAGDSFTIIANDGGDAVVGTFVGLAEGAVVNVNGTNKTLTYVGGDGNDVVLKPVVAAAPTVQFSQTTFTGNESMNGIATLTRTGDTSAASTVHVTTTPGTATAGSPCGTPATADYVTLSQDFTFAVNEMVKQVPVFLCSDTRHELAPETINLTVTAVSNAAIGTQATTVMAINDTASQFLNSDQTHPTHGPISFGSGSVGSPYPSSIAVTGGSNIGSMRVTIYDLSIDKPDDLDLLLVGPQGQKYALMTDVGGVITPIDPGNPVTITFSDYATDVLPDDGPLQTGQFLPTTCGGAVSNFPVGAPAGPYVEPGCDAPRAANETMAGTFAGSSNGTWSLYVRDDAGQLRPITAEGFNGGQIAAGWGLEFSSTTASDVSVSGRVTAADGRGITNATVSVTGGSLVTPLTAITGRNGAYTIAGLRVGETYIVTVGTRRFTFQEPSRVVNLTDNAVGVDFTASP